MNKVQNIIKNYFSNCPDIFDKSFDTASKYFISLLLFMYMNNPGAIGQTHDYSYSAEGTIIMNGIYNDTAFVSSCKKVVFLLDYETAEFWLYFNLADLHTGIDSLDELLLLQEGNYVDFEGKLGIEYIQTLPHQAQEFEVEGYMNCDYQCGMITGKGRLEYLFAGLYSCLLTLSFRLNVNQLPFVIPLENLHEEFEVEIVQPILIKNK